MSQNNIQPGHVIHAAATHPAAPDSGDPVIVGTIPGVAITDEGDGGNASTETSIAIKGVFELPVTGKDSARAAAAVAVGDKLYYSYSPTAAELTEIVKQIATITLSGTGGTATVTLAGGLTKTVTFGDDLEDTATDFVTSHADAYDSEGIVVTSDGADIIFTAKVAGTGFVNPAIATATDDLAGTVVATRSNGVFFGKALGTVEQGATPATANIPVMLVQS